MEGFTTGISPDGRLDRCKVAREGGGRQEGETRPVKARSGETQRAEHTLHVTE